MQGTVASIPPLVAVRSALPDTITSAPKLKLSAVSETLLPEKADRSDEPSVTVPEDVSVLTCKALAVRSPVVAVGVSRRLPTVTAPGEVND